jgi:hypothetical protein
MVFGSYNFGLCYKILDWDSIQIEKRWKEEGPQYIFAEDGLYAKLGLQKEDEKESKAREEACAKRAPVLG